MKVKLLDQAHPDFDEKLIDRLEGLYEGGQRWRKHVNEWLPTFEAELIDLGVERRKLATYTNHYAPLVDLLASMLFVEPPSVVGLDTHWPRLENNCDGLGTSARTFLRRWVGRAMRLKRSYVWVKLPRRSGDYTDRAQQEAAGDLDAYLCSVPTECVRNWGHTDSGHPWYMIREAFSRQSSVEDKRLGVVRWTYVDNMVIRRWEWVQRSSVKTDPRSDDEAEELEPIKHGIGKTPIVELNLETGLWVGSKVYDPVVAHIRADNELMWGMYRANHDMLVVQRKGGGKSGERLNIDVGKGYYLDMGPPNESDVKFVGPSGTVVRNLMEDVQRRVRAIYRVVQQLALAREPGASEARQSGESKALDFRAAEIVTAAVADVAIGAIRELMRRIGHAVDMPSADVDQIAVSGLDGWQRMSVEQFQAAWLGALPLREASVEAERYYLTQTADRLVDDAHKRAVIKRDVANYDPVAARAERDRALYAPTPPKSATGEGG